MPTEFTVDDAAVEGSTYAATVSFTDEAGNAVIPNAGLNWTLVKADRQTVVNNRSAVAITPAASVTIVLSGADLTCESSEPESWRYLVVQGTYDGDLGDNLPIVDHLKFPVKDVAKVGT